MSEKCITLENIHTTPIEKKVTRGSTRIGGIARIPIKCAHIRDPSGLTVHFTDVDEKKLQPIIPQEKKDDQKV